MALLLALGAAADAAADSTKYLLFDVIPHEQLNKQRRAYMFFLDLAMRLKRTLVLPRARLVKRDAYGRFLNDEAEYVRWGELFNLSALNTLHPAVELETFLQQAGEVTQLIKVDQVPPPPPAPRPHVHPPLRHCPPRHGRLTATRARQPGPRRAEHSALPLPCRFSHARAVAAALSITTA